MSNNGLRRVAVTGLGIVSPIGANAAEELQNGDAEEVDVVRRGVVAANSQKRTARRVDHKKREIERERRTDERERETDGRACTK